MEVYAKRDEAGKSDEKTGPLMKPSAMNTRFKAFGDRIAVRLIAPNHGSRYSGYYHGGRARSLEPIFDMESFEHMPELVAGPMVCGKKLKQVKPPWSFARGSSHHFHFAFSLLSNFPDSVPFRRRKGVLHKVTTPTARYAVSATYPRYCLCGRSPNNQSTYAG